MAGRKQKRIPFYGSSDPKEFLEWLEDMEYEFKDYAHDWWRCYTRNNLVRTWEDLKKAMRKEFVPREYEQI